MNGLYHRKKRENHGDPLSVIGGVYEYKNRTLEVVSDTHINGHWCLNVLAFR